MGVAQLADDITARVNGNSLLRSVSRAFIDFARLHCSEPLSVLRARFRKRPIKPVNLHSPDCRPVIRPANDLLGKRDTRTLLRNRIPRGSIIE